MTVNGISVGAKGCNLDQILQTLALAATAQPSLPCSQNALNALYPIRTQAASLALLRPPLRPMVTKDWASIRSGPGMYD